MMTLHSSVNQTNPEFQFQPIDVLSAVLQSTYMTVRDSLANMPLEENNLKKTRKNN